MNNKKGINASNKISRHIMFQYILSLLGFIIAIFAVYLIAWFICMQFTWHGDELLYRVLQALKKYAPVIDLVLVLIGLTALTYHYFLKLLGYLEEVTKAAQQISQLTEAPVMLSDELKDIQDKLNMARQQSLRSAAEAREAEQRKNDLIVYLAHDLKTPLTSVIGYLALLKEERHISPELQERYINIAFDKSVRLEELINEFFDITRFNLTHLTLEKETINLTMMLEQIAYEFNPVLAEKDLAWDMQLEPGIMILCDSDKLERVFDNLFRNAISYSYKNSHILVSMKENEGSAIINVKNHGRTIPSENLSRIFEQFFRVDSSRSSSTGGSGLGLAIAKEIVELHGGTIVAQSFNESITFTVTLPLQCKENT